MSIQTEYQVGALSQLFGGSIKTSETDHSFRHVLNKHQKKLLKVFSEHSNKEQTIIPADALKRPKKKKDRSLISPDEIVTVEPHPAVLEEGDQEILVNSKRLSKRKKLSESVPTEEYEPSDQVESEKGNNIKRNKTSILKLKKKLKLSNDATNENELSEPLENETGNKLKRKKKTSVAKLKNKKSKNDAVYIDQEEAVNEEKYHKRFVNSEPFSNIKQTARPELMEDDPGKISRTLFVGNLPQAFMRKSLKKLFKTYGPVESVRLRGAVPETPHIPKKSAIIEKRFHPQSTHIISYVVMVSEESAKNALDLNGREIDGHRIRVDLASNNTHDYKHSVFVGNMPYDIREDQVWDFFQECGEISNIRIIRDPVLGIGKGFGYVLFKSIDGVMLALQKNGSDLNGRLLRVFPSKSEKKLKKSQSDNAFGSPQGNYRSHKNVNNFNRNFEGVRSIRGRQVKKDVLKKIRKSGQKPMKEKERSSKATSW